MNDSEEGPFSEDDLEVEISAIGPESEGKHAESVQIWPPRGLSRRQRVRRLAFGSGALMVALLILLGSVPALRSRALVLVGVASPTPGLSYSPLTPQPQPDRGWRLAGPRYASEIAGAPSAPATLYVCGVQQSSKDQPSTLLVGVSHDSGNTWQTFSPPARAMSCYLTVNPTNARDVVLTAFACVQCTPPQASHVYRTFDGGKHWSAWSLPAPGPNQSADLWSVQWVWVGSTLFLAPILIGDSGFTRLAASVAGRPFVWLSTTALFAGAPADTGINGLYATSTTLTIELFSRTACQSDCFWYVQSRDDGVSWSPLNPMFQGQPVSLLATSADGRTLLGQVVHHDAPYSRTYLRSTDGGATWSALSPRPTGLAAEFLYAAPDGSVYGSFEQDLADPQYRQTLPAVVGIYALAPGATAWRYVSPFPKGGWFVVAWDARGHPSALWAPVDTNVLERRQL